MTIHTLAIGEKTNKGEFRGFDGEKAVFVNHTGGLSKVTPKSFDSIERIEPLKIEPRRDDTDRASFL